MGTQGGTWEVQASLLWDPHPSHRALQPLFSLCLGIFLERKVWAGEAECGNPPASLLFPWIWGAVGNGMGAAE